MSRLNQIDKEIAALNERIKNLKAERIVAGTRTYFVCGHCRKQTLLGSLDLISNYGYEEPHGCMGGDRWLYSHLSIVCPKCDQETRFYPKTCYRDGDPLHDKFKGLQGSFGRRFEKHGKNPLKLIF